MHENSTFLIIDNVSDSCYDEALKKLYQNPIRLSSDCLKKYKNTVLNHEETGLDELDIRLLNILKAIDR